MTCALDDDDEVEREKRAIAEEAEWIDSFPKKAYYNDNYRRKHKEGSKSGISRTGSMICPSWMEGE
jgi:hypothetical protein